MSYPTALFRLCRLVAEKPAFFSSNFFSNFLSELFFAFQQQISIKKNGIYYINLSNWSNYSKTLLFVGQSALWILLFRLQLLLEFERNKFVGYLYFCNLRSNQEKKSLFEFISRKNEGITSWLSKFWLFCLGS